MKFAPTASYKGSASFYVLAGVYSGTPQAITFNLTVLNIIDLSQGGMGLAPTATAIIGSLDGGLSPPAAATIIFFL